MATFYILLSALLHAIWNAFIKKRGRPAADLLCMFVFACALTALIHGLREQRAFSSSSGLAWATMAGVCEAGYFITLAKSMELIPMGILYMISRGGAMILVWLISLLFLGEALTFIQALAAISIFIGMLLAGANARDLKREYHLRELAWPSLCALTITGHHLSYARALAAQSAPTALFAYSVAIGVVGLMAANRQEWPIAWARFKQAPGTIIVMGSLCALSFILFLYGLAQSQLGHSMSLRNMSIVFAQLFAYAIGERPSKGQWLGACLVTLGAIFL